MKNKKEDGDMREEMRRDEELIIIGIQCFAVILYFLVDCFTNG